MQFLLIVVRMLDNLQTDGRNTGNEMDAKQQQAPSSSRSRDAYVLVAGHVYVLSIAETVRPPCDSRAGGRSHSPNSSVHANDSSGRENVALVRSTDSSGTRPTSRRTMH